MTERPRPEKVGYKSPPQSGRFKKGNRMGRRPRKPRLPDYYELFHKVLQRKVTLTWQDGGEEGVEKITIQKALLLRLRQEALKGARWAIILSNRVIAAQPPTIADAEAEEEMYELYTIKRDMFYEEVEAAAKRNEKPAALENTEVQAVEGGSSNDDPAE